MKYIYASRDPGTLTALKNSGVKNASCWPWQHLPEHRHSASSSCMIFTVMGVTHKTSCIMVLTNGVQAKPLLADLEMDGSSGSQTDRDEYIHKSVSADGVERAKPVPENKKNKPQLCHRAIKTQEDCISNLTQLWLMTSDKKMKPQMTSVKWAWDRGIESMHRTKLS